MAQQHINTGSNPNDGTGDPLRTAFIKTEDNFIELFESASFTTFPFTGSAQITGSEGLTGAVLGVTGSIETNGDIYVQTVRTSRVTTHAENSYIDLSSNQIELVANNVSHIKLDGSTNTLTINDSNADLDFIVQSNTENLLKADAGTNRVGIKVPSPQTDLHVKGSVSSSDYYGIITNTDPEIEGQFFQTSSQGVTAGSAGFTVICISQG